MVASRRISFRILIFLALCYILSTVVFAQVSQRKPGDCPPLPDIGICEMTCFRDNHCAGAQKCCRTACGGTYCINPITMRKLELLQEKAGDCPEPSGPWVCSSRCAYDADCRGRRKCCKNRCGAMACLLPEV